jgi:1-deoxy-D-xylulose-5-phosphate synthase
LAAAHALVVTVEDNGEVGAVGDAVARELRRRDIAAPVRSFALPQQFLAHGRRADLISEMGLSAQSIAREVVEAVARHSAVVEQSAD